MAPQRAPRVVGAIGLVPTALAVIAEAAWVAIVAGLLQAFTRHPPVVGYAWFLAAAVVGLVAARVLEARAGNSWPRRRRRPRDGDRRVRLAPLAGGPVDPAPRTGSTASARPSPPTSAAGCSPSRSFAGSRTRACPPTRAGSATSWASRSRDSPRSRSSAAWWGSRSAARSSARRRRRSSCSSSRRSRRSRCRGSGWSRPGRPSTGAATRPGSSCCSCCWRSRRSWRSPRRCSQVTRS